MGRNNESLCQEVSACLALGRSAAALRGATWAAASERRRLGLWCIADRVLVHARGGRLFMRCACWRHSSLFCFLYPSMREEPRSACGARFWSPNCAGCHAVRAADNMSPNSAAPTFVSVAKTPGMTGRALAVWLQTSHPTMPNFVVAEKDRDNVIAYIMSLQPPPAH